MADTSAYAKSYNSFSGVDIKAVFGNTAIAELQAISYSVTREKAPLYTMGSADPRSFSRGKRGIAGTLVFIVFDRHALLSVFGQDANPTSQKYFQSDIDDVAPMPVNINDVSGTASIASVGSVAGAAAGAAAGSIAQYQESNLTTLNSDQIVVAPWFVDQIPPFDITLAAANEYGALAVMRIYGVEVLNEGCGVSIDDIVTEQQMTYVARTLAGWKSIGYVDITTKSNSPTIIPR